MGADLPDVEKAFWKSRPHSYGVIKKYHAIPRVIKVLVFAILTYFILRIPIQRYQDRRDHALKLQPTNFTALAHSLTTSAYKPPSQPVRQLNGAHIDDRYLHMRELGSGKEGSAALYVDVPTGDVVVVKTFFSHGQNTVPLDLAGEFSTFSTSWPSEIEAGLLLAGSKIGNDSLYVPVKDYFILQVDSSDWSWAMVTPFVGRGNLEELAEATKVHKRTPQKLDIIFRPVLNAVLERLSPLHAAGYCHNDIKPDNVFIADTKHWLLGDLGSVREFHHPWHTTRRIRRENQWSDCKQNDVRRALKTYLWFIRNACGDLAAFDSAFYVEEQAWSKLYWDFIRQPASIEVMLERSKELDPNDQPEWKSEDSTASVESACLQRKVERALTCTTLYTHPSDWWPFSGC